MLTYVSATFLIFALPAGFVATRFGRRRTILAGLTALLVFILGGYFTTNMTYLTVMLDHCRHRLGPDQHQLVSHGLGRCTRRQDWLVHRVILLLFHAGSYRVPADRWRAHGFVGPPQHVLVLRFFHAAGDRLHAASETGRGPDHDVTPLNRDAVRPAEIKLLGVSTKGRYTKPNRASLRL